MSPVDLPVVQGASPSAAPPPASASALADEPPPRDAAWRRTARLARMLSWASLLWMTTEGVVGLIAGLDARALSVTVWAASSFVEGLASVVVIWRFTGPRTLSQSSERRAQRLVAGSFLMLVPFFGYEAIRRLVLGGDARTSALGMAVTASAVVLMPGLGWAKLRLGARLGSTATAGEGVQNLMCAAQAATALIALVGASAGLGILDPVAALVVAAIAAGECAKLWRGEGDDCCAPIGFDTGRDDCCASGRHCC